MNKNDIFEIEITGMTDDGDGVGRAEGIAVFVPYTIVGEKVRIHIIKVNKTYAIGKLIEVVSPSEHRLKAECEHFYKCGGCQMWHMDYDAELEFKENKVRDCIRRIGGIDTEISPIIGADNIKRYRNKMQMPVAKEGIGFYKKNSHIVTDMDDCLLQSEEAIKITECVRMWIADYNIQPYDEESGDGVIRNIYTRSGDNETSVVIVTATDDIPYKKELVEAIISADVNVSGIIQNVNLNRNNTLLGKKNVLLWGRDYIKGSIGEAQFEISPHSFYQVNKEQTYKLYSIAKRMADLTGGETVWDLYCGIGTIGQFMAKDAKKLFGIEIVPSAVINAKRNAEKNGLVNAEYYCGAAEKLAPQLIKAGGRPDVVILDPPRKGCDEKLLQTVVSASPKKIVYISCKPSTLARDLKFLGENGYKITEIVPVDMFPRTSHCEVVCRCERK